MKIKREHLTIIVVLLIGAVARIIKFDDPNLVEDTATYARLGKNLIESGRYAFGENYNTGVFYPPGYPVFIGLIDLIFRDLFFSAKLVSFISSCVSIFLSYLIGKKLYNKEAGLFAALLFAVYPVIIIVSVQGYADALYICFLLLSILLFLISLKRNNAIDHILLGILFSVTYLIRPEGIFLLTLPFLQVFGVFSEKIEFNKRYLLRTVTLSLIFALIISPYMLFIINYTGKFSLSGKGTISILLGELSGDRKYHEVVNTPENPFDKLAYSLNNDKSQLKGWDKNATLSLKDYVLKDPVAFARKYQKNLIQEISILIKLLIPVLLPLFFSFFYSDLFEHRKKLIFLLMPILLFLMYPSFIIIEKQTLLIVVYLLIFSSGGFTKSQAVISSLAHYYNVNKNKASVFLEMNIKYIMIAILVLGSLSYLKYSTFESFEPSPKPEEHKRAGHFLKTNVTEQYEKLNVMGKKPYVSFYSDSKYTMLPYAGSADVVHFAKLYNVDYIAIDERALSKWDYYGELMEMDKYSDEVELVYEDNTERLFKLFKVKK